MNNTIKIPIQITVAFPLELNDRLMDECVRESRQRTFIIRKAVEEYLTRKEENLNNKE